jgi:hypothetical protein|tara:strand:- start:5739 stop:5933 length:195 start_codon:yes stop_codon:yes gene_type:complete
VVTPALVLAPAEVLVAFATPERLTPRESPAMGRNEGTLMTFIFSCDFLVAARGSLAVEWIDIVF